MTKRKMKKIDMNAIEPEAFSPLMASEDSKARKKSKKKGADGSGAGSSTIAADKHSNPNDTDTKKSKWKGFKKHHHHQQQHQAQQQQQQPVQELSLFERLKQDPNYVSFDKESDQGETYTITLRLAKSPTEPIIGTERVLELKSGETIQNIKKKLLDTGGGRFSFKDVVMYMDGKELINPFSLVDIPQINRDKKADINVVIKCDPPLTALPAITTMSSVPQDKKGGDFEQVPLPPPSPPQQHTPKTLLQKQPPKLKTNEVKLEKSFGNNKEKKNIKLDLSTLSKGKDIKLTSTSPNSSEVRIVLQLVKTPSDTPAGSGQELSVMKGDTALTVKKKIAHSLKAELHVKVKAKNIDLYFGNNILDDNFNNFLNNAVIKVVISKCSQPVATLPSIVQSYSTPSSDTISPPVSILLRFPSDECSTSSSQHTISKSDSGSNLSLKNAKRKSKLKLPFSKQQQQQQQPVQELSLFERLKQDPNYVSFDKESDQGETYTITLRLAKSPTEPIIGTERVLELKSGETIQNIKKKLLDTGGGRFSFKDVVMYMDGKELINPFSLVDIPQINRDKKADINVVIKCDPPLTALPAITTMSSVPQDKKGGSRTSPSEQHLPLPHSPPQGFAPKAKKLQIRMLNERTQSSSTGTSSCSSSSGSSYSSTRSHSTRARSSESRSSRSSSSTGSSGSSSSSSRSSSSSSSSRMSSSASSSASSSGFSPDGPKKGSVPPRKASVDPEGGNPGDDDNELRKIYGLRHKEGQGVKGSRSSSETNISKSDKGNEDEFNASSSDGGVDIDVDEDGDSSFEDGLAKKSKSQGGSGDHTGNDTKDVGAPEKYPKSHKHPKKGKNRRRHGSKHYSSESSERTNSGYSSESSMSHTQSPSAKASSTSATDSSSRSDTLDTSEGSSSSYSSSSAFSSSSSSSLSSGDSRFSSSSDSQKSEEKQSKKGKRHASSSKDKHKKGKRFRSKYRHHNNMSFLISELEYTYVNLKKATNKRTKRLKKEIKKRDNIIEGMKMEREYTAKAGLISFTPNTVISPNEVDPPSPGTNVPMTARYGYGQVPALAMAQLPPLTPVTSKGPNPYVIPQTTGCVPVLPTARVGVMSPTMLSPHGSGRNSLASSEEGTSINDVYNNNMMIITMLNNDKQQLLNDKQFLLSQLVERNHEYDILREKYETLKKKYDELCKSKK